MRWCVVNFTLLLLYPGQKHPSVNLLRGWMSPAAGRDETRDTYSIGDGAVRRIVSDAVTKRKFFNLLEMENRSSYI